MKEIHISRLLFGIATLLILIFSPFRLPAQEPKARNSAGLTEAEARKQAQLLHEAMHATLHVVHVDYYRENERLLIPAASLKKVFRELATRQNVQLRWLAVDADAMNADHHPSTEFEKEAVKALSSGKTAFERTESNVFRRAGAITLTSECLRCHAPTRTSTKDRKAALVITIPLAAPTKPDPQSVR